MPQLLNIQLSEINSTPLFKTRFGRDDRILETSIQTHNVICPPVLLKKKNQYYIIDGFIRIAESKRLKKECIQATIYSENELSIIECFLLCLELNRWTREFNMAEKSFLLSQAIDIFTLKNIPKIFWESIKIKQNYKNISLYQELNKLPEPILKHAIVHNLPENVMLLFAKFPKEEQSKVANKLFVLPLNQNKLGEVLNLIYEISKRDNTLPSIILNSVLEQLSKETSATERVSQLRYHLKTKRHPKLTKYEETFQNKLNKIKQNDHIKIEHAPFFENKHIQITAKLAQKKDIDNLIKTLNDPEIMNLIKLDY